LKDNNLLRKRRIPGFLRNSQPASFAQERSHKLPVNPPCPPYPECLSTKTTLSPLKNIFEIYRSLLIVLPFFPCEFRGVSFHISRTLIKTMLLCRSNALTRASNLRLFRSDIRTWSWFWTAVLRTLRGPLWNSKVSSSASSVSVSSPFGLFASSLGAG
jgi:hypothetical protein